MSYLTSILPDFSGQKFEIMVRLKHPASKARALITHDRFLHGSRGTSIQYTEYTLYGFFTHPGPEGLFM